MKIFFNVIVGIGCIVAAGWHFYGKYEKQEAASVVAANKQSEAAKAAEDERKKRLAHVAHVLPLLRRAGAPYDVDFALGDLEPLVKKAKRPVTEGQLFAVADAMGFDKGGHIQEFVSREDSREAAAQGTTGMYRCMRMTGERFYPQGLPETDAGILECVQQFRPRNGPLYAESAWGLVHFHPDLKEWRMYTFQSRVNMLEGYILDRLSPEELERRSQHGLAQIEARKSELGPDDIRRRILHAFEPYIERPVREAQLTELKRMLSHGVGLAAGAR